MDRIAFLQSHLEKQPDDPFPRYALALEHRSRGDSAQAAELLAELIRRAPGYVPAYLMAGQLLQQLGRRDEARETLTAGQAQARTAGDRHALSEITSALESL